MRELDDAGTRAVLAIQRVQAAYADAVTRRDWADVRALFEPDAAVHIDTRSRPAFTLEGPDAVVEFIDEALRPFAFFEMANLNGTVDLSDGGAEATGRMYICELRLDREGSWTEAYGLYRDRYLRRDGGSEAVRRPGRSLLATSLSPSTKRVLPFRAGCTCVTSRCR